MKRSILAVILAVTLCGCGGSFQPKAPLPATTFSNPFIVDLSSPTMFSDYHAMPEGPAKVARRNQILFEEMWLTDQSYDKFENGFFTGQGFINFASETTAMALDMAGAVTGTAHLKAVLAAVSGGVTGVQANYQKAFLDQQTRNVIVQVMRSSRLAQRAVIEAGMASCSTAGACSSTAGYTLEQGLMDVSAYYDDGTIIGALITISESSSQTSGAARQALRTIRKIPN